MKRNPLHILLLPLLLFLSGAVCGVKGVSNIQKISGRNLQAVYPVLLVQFSDVKFVQEDPVAAYDAMLNGVGYSVNGASGSAAEYFNDNFKGKAEFVFRVSDVITLSGNQAFYGEKTPFANDRNMELMVREALDIAAVQGMDYSGCDNDNDGKIDNVSIIFAGYSEAEGGGENSLWPHQAKINDPDMVFQELGIASYSCSAALKGNSGSEICAIGSFCHEFCHSLGLPDLYDTNGEEEGEAKGLHGMLSIMDRGYFSDGGNTPPKFSAIEKEILGLAVPVDIYPNKRYTLSADSRNQEIYRIRTENEGEYFLIELRLASGWDRFAGGEGLVVYHVDKSEKVYGGLRCADRWEYNNINTFAAHECAHVVLPQQEESSGSLFFPGSGNVTELVSWKGYMPLRSWDGYPVGIAITEIEFDGKSASFTTNADYDFDRDMPQVVAAIATPFQKEAYIEWKTVFADAVHDNVAWKVMWKEKGEQEWHSTVSDTTWCSIAGLVPGKTYEVAVNSVDGWSIGPVHKMNFSTAKISSSFPYMHLLKKETDGKTLLQMRVFNMPQNTVSLKWVVDDVQIDGDSAVLGRGEHKIEAVLRYSNATEEKIVKYVEIEN